MAMTEEERFRFDLTGFLLRPAILNSDQIGNIIDQIDRIKHNPDSLSPEHREVPGGPSSVTIDHPKVIEVLHEIIGPDIRMESTSSIWRTKGQQHGGLHGGGPNQIDQIFGYQSQNGKIRAGMVRVIFELTDISKGDGATCFLLGSHKANFPIHSNHLSLEDGQQSEFLHSYDCPAGSAIFFTENLCHAGPIWKRNTPRVAILNAYSHLATHWHRLKISPTVLSGLSRQKQAYFRQPWIADFRTQPATHNTIERFVDNEEPPINTDHQP